MKVQKTSFEKPIMVVDDEFDIVQVVGRALQREGFEVDAFSNPQEALANFKRDRYCLVITDIKMPKLNGLELYSRILKIDPAARVGFLTAYEMHDYEFKRAHPEINSIAFALQKPVSISILLRRVRQELQRTGVDALSSDSLPGKTGGLEKNAE